MTNVISYSREKEKKYQPHELLKMYRSRAGLTQSQLAQLIGLKSARMIQKWECGDSLPEANRLKKIIELYLIKHIFVIDSAMEEAQQLWKTVKNWCEANSEKYEVYPIFDERWFNNLLQNYQSQVITSNTFSKSNLSQFVDSKMVKPEPAIELAKTTPLAEIFNKLPPPNVPAPINRLIGREAEVQQISHLLIGQETRLITLIGVAGTGKTRLALAVAAELLDYFNGKVYFISLAATTKLEQLVSNVAKVLKVKEVPNQSMEESLIYYLRDKSLFLVLDNFEQLVNEAAFLTKLLSSTPNLKVLVTSREILHVYGEQEFQITPLPLPNLSFANYAEEELPLKRLEELCNYPSIQLFAERARLVKPDFRLTSENILPIVKICTYLDGLPLAIELAATRIKLFTPQMLLKQLAGKAGLKLALLQDNARDKPARHQTLHNTLDWSYNLLDLAEQSLFRRLSVFAGGCTLEAARAICSETANDATLTILNRLNSLIDKSLLQRAEDESGEPRFRMLETLRAYGQEQLEKANETVQCSRKHYAFYLALAETPDLKDEQLKDWLCALEHDHDNLRAALGWSIEQTQWESGLRLANAVSKFWYRYNYWSEGRDWFDRLLNGNVDEMNLVRALALTQAGRLASRAGDYHRAIELSEASLQVYQQIGDLEGRSQALDALGTALRQQGDLPGATALLQESLALHRRLQDKPGIAATLIYLGNVLRLQGDYEQATRLLQESKLLFSELNDKWSLATVLSYLGVIERDQGDYAEAKRFLQKSLLMRQELNDQSLIASTISNLGLVEWFLGNYEQSENLLQKSLALQRLLNDKWGLGYTLIQQGRIKRLRHEYVLSRSFLLESLSLRQEMGDRHGIARCLEELAATFGRQNYLTLAANLFGAAQLLRRSLNACLPPAERQDYEQELENVRSRLAPPIFEMAWAEGEKLSLEQAIATAFETV